MFNAYDDYVLGTIPSTDDNTLLSYIIKVVK